MNINDPSIGKVIPQFEVTQALLDKGANLVTDSVVLFEQQRDTQVSNDTKRKSWRKRLVQADRAYRGILEPDRGYKGFDDKCAPIIHDNVETIVSRLTEAILPTDETELVTIETEEGTPQEKEYAEFRSKQINRQFEKQDIRKKVDRFVRSAVKFGDAFIKVPLENKESMILTQQMVTKKINTPIVDQDGNQLKEPNGQPMVMTEEKTTVEVVPEVDKKYFGPGYQVMSDIEKIYYDSYIEDIQDQPIVIEEKYLTYEDLAQGVREGKYIPEQVSKIKDTQSDVRVRGIYYETRSEEVRGTSNVFVRRNKEGAPKIYKIYEAWADFEVEVDTGNGEKARQVHKVCITVSNSNCIGFYANPYFHQMKPYIRGSYRLVEGEGYAISAVDPVLDLFHTYCDTMNQIADGNVLALNPIKIAKGNNITEQQDLQICPGITWYEKETGDIRFASMDFPMQEGQQYLELLEQRINRGMGITPLLLGSGDDSDLDKTWRGTNKIIAEASKKFRSIAKNLEDACIRQVGEMFYKVDEQFLPVLKPDGTAFNRINAEVNFVADGVDSWFDKMDKIVNYNNFIASYNALPGLNVAGLVNTVAEMQGITVNEAKYGPIYKPPPPPEPPTKPLNVSVSVPLDPSKGKFQTMALQQLLKEEYGIELDYDANKEAQLVDSLTTPIELEKKSGTLPPQYDSYQESDKRTKKIKKETKK